MEEITLLNLREINLGPLKATISLYVGGGVMLHDFRIVEEDGELQVFPPQRKERAQDGEMEYYPIVEFVKKDQWSEIQTQILDYYTSHTEGGLDIQCRVLPYSVFQTSLYVLGFNWFLAGDTNRKSLASLQILESFSKERVGLFFLFDGSSPYHSLLNKIIVEASNIVGCDELCQFDELGPGELKKIIGWEFKMSNLEDIPEEFVEEVFDYFHLDDKFRGKKTGTLGQK